MNHRTKPNHRGSVALVTLGLLLAGCATPAGDKPGSGIIEYRKITQEAHGSVAATVDALDALKLPNPSLASFDRAFHELELTSVRARARAEAIIARGQAYFDEWKEHLGAITNQTTASAEGDRYNRMFEHFERVRQRSGDVREQFRPFMAKLREFRARLDRPANESVRVERNTLSASGRGVLRALESISAELDQAEASLRTNKRSI